jgi:hypothetical protein
MNAFPVFKVMLQHNNFQEGVALSKGKAEIPLPDYSHVAFAIILRIIHNHTKDLPFNIELPLLTEIAILVDKYRMLEAVRIFARLVGSKFAVIVASIDVRSSYSMAYDILGI